MAKQVNYHWPETYTGTLQIGGNTVSRPETGVLTLTEEEERLLPLNIFGFGFYQIEESPQATPEKTVNTVKKDPPILNP